MHFFLFCIHDHWVFAGSLVVLLVSMFFHSRLPSFLLLVSFSCTVSRSLGHSSQLCAAFPPPQFQLSPLHCIALHCIAPALPPPPSSTLFDLLPLADVPARCCAWLLHPMGPSSSVPPLRLSPAVFSFIFRLRSKGGARRVLLAYIIILPSVCGGCVLSRRLLHEGQALVSRLNPPLLSSLSFHAIFPFALRVLQVTEGTPDCQTPPILASDPFCKLSLRHLSWHLHRVFFSPLLSSPLSILLPSQSSFH